jgi:hypothetical protein
MVGSGGYRRLEDGALATRHEGEPLRVLLACEPLLLQEVLVEMLSLMRDVELVDADSPQADVVLVSAAGRGGAWPERLPAAAATAPRVLVVDPVRNRIRIRERRDGRVTERQIDGNMVLLPELMRQRPPAEPPIAETA